MSDTTKESKTTAIISYLTIVGTIIAMLTPNEKKDSYSAFHIRQALGINVTFFVLGYFIGNFDSWAVTFGFWILIFVLWLYGFFGALQGKLWAVPILGGLFQKLFKNVK